MRQASKWFNAIANAWNRGEAPWAYPGGRSRAVRIWARFNRMRGPDAADNAVITWAQRKGIRITTPASTGR